MIRTIISSILVLVGVFMLFARAGARKDVDPYSAKGFGWTAVGVFVAAAVLIATASFTVVPANHAGVEVLFGKPTRTFGEGLNIKNPIATVSKIPGLQQESTYSNAVDEGEKGGPDAIRARTLDNAEVDVDATVLWALDLTAAFDTYRQYRTIEQVRSVLLRPVSRDVIRDCIAGVAFEEAGTSERQTIGNCAQANIAAAVSPYVSVRAVQIREVDLLSDQIRSGIERKLAAEQAAQEAEFRRQQALIDAETARIAAEGIAKAEIERARGIAEANHLVNESLTPTLLAYRKYEFLSQVGNTTWVIEGEGAVDPVLVVNE